ncbi:MAG: hypothetical protein V7607_5692 [Solirubrobacteraceae bacterium]
MGQARREGLFDLSGRTAAVTGGGTHIGRAIAEVLAEYGASVFVLGRRAEPLERTAEALQARGLACRPMVADAASEQDVQCALDAIVEDCGQLDVMICNAGAAAASQLFPNLLLDELHETLRACVDTAAICAQEAARRMIPRRSGRIVLVGSIHGELGADPRTYTSDFARSGISYNAAKGAVVNLARALACELGDYDITVNCLSPGQVPDPANRSDTIRRFAEKVPLRRTGTPDDMKGAALLLASDAGAWITGHNLIVDGGWSAW